VEGVLTKIFGSNNEREIKRLWPLVNQINSLEDTFLHLSNAELQAKTPEFKQRLEQGESLDDILPEAFALVRESAKRELGMRHFDVQLIGGSVLHSGKIAEMKTGEGKTLVATLPAYLNALSGKGVHVVTVNDYLASRDAEWMGKLYRFLGLSVGVVVQGMDKAERLAAYQSDITYGQNNEFGFDYLRDNMKLELSEMVQRGHNFAIVDEVDSILIDEARTPLIISGPTDQATDTYLVANELVPKLVEERDYSVELKTKQVTLTDDGVHTVEELLGIENLYDPRHIELVHHVNQALKAHATMNRDKDYVVRNGQVIIVDEFTGRLMSGRRWSDGLHQAVEAKEGVKIQQENQTLATITFQNYFRFYSKLSGMTGTADTEAPEFKKIYNLDVIVVPTNEPMIREDNPDVVFTTERGKFKAVVEEIEDCRERGQPVLVGTASIHKSELVSNYLKKKNIPHDVLNAKQHEREADIVAQAGRLGAVTISTNMAGRGTDIVLGGNPEFLAADEVGTRDPEDPEFQEALKRYTKECSKEKERVLEAGGLHVLGTERHESRRIDNQLRGRSGRQGDPGSSRFYVSLEDDLMRRFGGERMQNIMQRVGLQEDEAVEGRLVGRAIENAQKKVEGYHFDIRKHLLEYDDVMNKQREVLYSRRSKVLKEGTDEEELLEIVDNVIEDLITARASEKEPPREWDVEGMLAEYKRLFGEAIDGREFLEVQESAGKDLAQRLFEDFAGNARLRYKLRKEHFGQERMSHLQRIVHLQAIDYYWKEHLQNMDHLKEGIGLRGYGQRNPLQEYQREAFELFQAMIAAVEVAIIQNVFVPELPSEEELRRIEEEERAAQQRREQQAQMVHQEMSTMEGDESSGADTSGLNRRQRRRQQAIETKGAANYQPQAADYAPTTPSQSKGGSNRAARRKKNKQARKSRRRSR